MAGTLEKHIFLSETVRLNSRTSLGLFPGPESYQPYLRSGVQGPTSIAFPGYPTKKLGKYLPTPVYFFVVKMMLVVQVW